MEEEHDLSLGKYLKEMRKQSGLTIKQIVNMSEGILDKTTISRIERNERGLSLKAAYAFSKTYNIDIMELTEYAIEKKITPERVPFDTNEEEQALIEEFRVLSDRRKKALKEILRGLAMAAEENSSIKVRRKLKETLSYYKAQQPPEHLQDNHFSC